MLSKERKDLYEKLEAQTGNTPIFEITKIKIPNGNRIFAKEEWKNPTESIFDRVYPHLFKIAEEDGKIVPGLTPVIETSTGNAGASFAWCSRELGYHDCTVVIHEDAPPSRTKQIRSYGAKIIFSPSGQYSKGCVKKLEEILKEDKKIKGGKVGENLERLYCVTKISPRAREVYQRFAIEVMDVMHKVDFFVGVVGSGTSISGISKYLKEVDPAVKVIAVDPEETPSTYSLKYEKKLIDYERMPHNVWGGSTFGLPLEKLNLDLGVIDEVRLVGKEERKYFYKLLVELEGKDVGRTSCCVLAVACRLAKEIKDRNILICFYDSGWKYESNNSMVK